MNLELVQNKIYKIREQQVMLDFDLAEMYGVQTKRLKEQVKRNIERFPDDFMFELSKKEWNELVANCDQLNIKHSYVTPYAFTQEGIAMLSGILRSPVAIQVNIGIMRAFVSVRHYLIQAIESNGLEYRLQLLEKANEEILKDMNDLSEDTRNTFEELFDAFVRLANELKNTSERSIRNPIGYTVGKF